MSKAALIDDIRALVLPLLDSAGVECVDLEVKGSTREPLIRIFADEPGGIRIEKCVALTREIRDILDIEGVVGQNYRVEVSSPGVDRPLKTARDFERNLNRRVAVVLRSEGSSREISGEIVAVTGDEVLLRTKAGERNVPLAEIERALIQISW